MLVHHRIPSMKWLGVLLLPLDGMLVHHTIPSMKWLAVLLLPTGWDASPSQDTQHEETSSIATPPGWDASPSQDTQHEVTRSILLPAGWDSCASKDVLLDFCVRLSEPIHIHLHLYTDYCMYRAVNLPRLQIWRIWLQSQQQQSALRGVASRLNSRDSVGGGRGGALLSLSNNSWNNTTHFRFYSRKVESTTNGKLQQLYGILQT